MGTPRRSDKLLLLWDKKSTNAYKVILSLNFNSNVSRQDIVNNNQLNPTFKTEYLLNYDPSIQEANAELTDAIFEALGVEDTGATRILIAQNIGGVGDSQFGQYSKYKVVEIKENEIHEYEIVINYSEDLIEQLNNKNFRKESEKTVEINGRKLVA